MRDLLTIFSLLVTIVFGVFNYHQFASIRSSLVLIDELNNLQVQMSADQLEAHEFYRRIFNEKGEPPELFERFSEGAFFSGDYERSFDILQGLISEQSPGLIPMLQNISEVRRVYNRLNYDHGSREDSLKSIQRWLAQVDSTYGEGQLLVKEIVQAQIDSIQKRIEQTVPLDIAMILLIFSIWYWLGYDKQKRHLQATMALNQDLERKQANLLSSQKVMASIYEDMRQERTRAVALASDNQQLAAIVQQANDAIFRLDFDGRVLSANRACTNLFPASEFMIGCAFSGFFTREDQWSIGKSLSEIMASSEHKTLHLKPLDADGNHDGQQVYEASFSMLSDHNENLENIVVVVRDISHQYQEVEQLRKIIYQAPNALIMVNSKGVIVLCNDKANQLSGYSEADLLGEEIERLVPPELHDHHSKKRKAYMQLPQPRRMGEGRELKLRRRNGALIPVEIGLSPITAKNRSYIIASIVDISESVNQQKALNLFNRQLTEKNREMEQFIYTVSHDLRSPLVTIEAFARKLASELEGSLTEKQAHRLSRIQANVAHMEQLLTDLLSLSRVIKRELEARELDTSKQVAKLLNTLEAEMAEVDAEVVVEEPLSPIRANDSLFYQCLQNLVVNAIRYRDTQRKLRIRIATVHKNDMTGLVVEDNGVGIDPRYHAKIFGIFERLEEGSGGTGVGLAIVNAVVDKHNGKIELASEVGSGSRFTLYFPDSVHSSVTDEPQEDTQ